MEIRVTLFYVLTSIVCIVVVTGLIKLVNWIWLKPKKLERLLRNQGFSGNSYNFLFGDLKDFISMRNQALKTPMITFSHEYLPRVDPLRHSLSTKYGSNDNFLWFGPIPMLSISNPELIKEALTKTQVFQKAKLNPLLGKLFPGLVSYEGEKWAKHRKLINPAFQVEKLKVISYKIFISIIALEFCLVDHQNRVCKLVNNTSRPEVTIIQKHAEQSGHYYWLIIYFWCLLQLMLPAFRDSCAEIISKWDTAVHETGSFELDVWPDLMKLTADVISRAAFGSNYEQGQQIFKLIKEQIDLTLIMIQSVYFPGKRHIPTARNRRFKGIERQLHTALYAIINKRKEAIEAGEAPLDDLLGILMDSNSKEIQQANGNNKNQHKGMTLHEVIQECKLFYLAGQETTSILLVWTLILLSKHQDWQARAGEEIIRTFGDNVPDYEGLSHLKTVNMILYEVLRLYPPAMQISRWIPKDTNLGAFAIPSGALIAFYLYHVHRDQEIWGDDAHEFKPDRFAEGISKATKGKNSYFPFGWGPRICIGEKFAMAEAKMAISMILKCFSLELSPSYIHAPMTVMFLQPQHGAQIILHKL